MISPEDLSLFRVTDNIEETVAEVLGFYRVFHSMEYVNSRLVLRLTKRLSQRTLAGLQREFADILVEGIFRQESVVLGEPVRPEFDGLTPPRIPLQPPKPRPTPPTHRRDQLAVIVSGGVYTRRLPAAAFQEWRANSRRDKRGGSQEPPDYPPDPPANLLILKLALSF